MKPPPINTCVTVIDGIFNIEEAETGHLSEGNVVFCHPLLSLRAHSEAVVVLIPPEDTLPQHFGVHPSVRCTTPHDSEEEETRQHSGRRPDVCRERHRAARQWQLQQRQHLLDNVAEGEFEVNLRCRSSRRPRSWAPPPIRVGGPTSANIQFTRFRIEARRRAARQNARDQSGLSHGSVPPREALAAS